MGTMLGAIMVAVSLPAAAGLPTYDIRVNSAVGDGATLCTEAIQATIDACADDGGGTVYIPRGRWLSGTVYLGSNVTLYIDAGATLLGSRRVEDYAAPHRNAGGTGISSLVAARGAENIAVRGRGTIDVQGDAFLDKSQRRPKAIHFVGCRDVVVDDIHLRAAGSWMFHLEDCDRVSVRGISIFNHGAYNNDGLDIDSCRDVTVSDCRIDTDDDALVLKSRSTKPCENITVTNCIVSSHCNGIKMGTESGGGFKNIVVSNCVVRSPRFTSATYGRDRGLAGLALEIVDGGTLERVAISNIAIQGVTAPVFIRLGNRARIYEEDRPKPAVGALRNVIISNVVATDASPIGCAISGIPGHDIENLTLSNIRIGFEGGGTSEDADRAIPEREDAYPESTMFGTLPAYGLFVRHVRGIVLDNVRLSTDAPELRPAVVLQDVAQARIQGFEATCSDGAPALVRANNVRDLLVQACAPSVPKGTFLSVAGKESDGIALLGNDFRLAGRAWQLAQEVDEEALQSVGNVVGN